MDLWEEDHGGEVTFSTHDIKGIAMNMTCHWCCWSRSLVFSIIFSLPPFPSCSLWEQVPLAYPTARDGEGGLVSFLSGAAGCSRPSCVFPAPALAAAILQGAVIPFTEESIETKIWMLFVYTAARMFFNCLVFLNFNFFIKNLIFQLKFSCHLQLNFWRCGESTFPGWVNYA